MSEGRYEIVPQCPDMRDGVRCEENIGHDPTKHMGVSRQRAIIWSTAPPASDRGEQEHGQVKEAEEKDVIAIRGVMTSRHVIDLSGNGLIVIDQSRVVRLPSVVLLPLGNPNQPEEAASRAYRRLAAEMDDSPQSGQTSPKPSTEGLKIRTVSINDIPAAKPDPYWTPEKRYYNPEVRLQYEVKELIEKLKVAREVVHQRDIEVGRLNEQVRLLAACHDDRLAQQQKAHEVEIHRMHDAVNEVEIRQHASEARVLVLARDLGSAQREAALLRRELEGSNRVEIRVLRDAVRIGDEEIARLQAAVKAQEANLRGALNERDIETERLKAEIHRLHQCPPWEEQRRLTLSNAQLLKRAETAGERCLVAEGKVERLEGQLAKANGWLKGRNEEVNQLKLKLDEILTKLRTARGWAAQRDYALQKLDEKVALLEKQLGEEQTRSKLYAASFNEASSAKDAAQERARRLDQERKDGQVALRTAEGREHAWKMAAEAWERRAHQDERELEAKKAEAGTWLERQKTVLADMLSEAEAREVWANSLEATPNESLTCYAVAQLVRKWMVSLGVR